MSMADNDKVNDLNIMPSDDCTSGLQFKRVLPIEDPYAWWRAFEDRICDGSKEGLRIFRRLSPRDRVTFFRQLSPDARKAMRDQLQDWLGPESRGELDALMKVSELPESAVDSA